MLRNLASVLHPGLQDLHGVVAVGHCIVELARRLKLCQRGLAVFENEIGATGFYIAVAKGWFATNWEREQIVLIIS